MLARKMIVRIKIIVDGKEFVDYKATPFVCII